MFLKNESIPLNKYKYNTIQYFWEFGLTSGESLKANQYKSLPEMPGVARGNF